MYEVLDTQTASFVLTDLPPSPWQSVLADAIIVQSISGYVEKSHPTAICVQL